MDAAVKECVEQGAPGGSFILAPGCALPWDMKPSNIKAFLEAAEHYGDMDYVQKLT